MRLRLLTLLIVALAAQAQDAPPSLLPLVRQPQGPTPERVAILRGQQTATVFAPEAGAELRLEVKFVAVGQYTDAATVRVEGLEPSVKVGLAAQGLPQTAELVVKAPRAGLFTVVSEAGRNAVELRPTPQTPWLTLTATAEQPRGVMSHSGSLYFYVPAGVTVFGVHVRGGGPGEPVGVTVFDPAGEVRGTAATPNREPVEAGVRVPDGQDGQVWSLRLDKPPALDGVFEDAQVWLSPELPGALALRPDGLLVPFAHGLRDRPRLRGGQSTELPLRVNVAPLPGERLRAVVERGGRPVAQAEAGAAEGVTLRLPANTPPGDYTVTAELSGPGGLRARDTAPLRLTERLVFPGGWHPLVTAALLPQEGSLPRLLLRNALGGETPPLDVAVTLSRSAPSETPGHPGAEVLAQTELKLGAGEQEAALPALPAEDGHYRWSAVAELEGEVLEQVTGNTMVWQGTRFTEVPPPAAPPMPPLAALPRHAWAVPYVPAAAEGVPYNDRPTPGSMRRPLVIRATPGEWEPGTFALWCPAGAREVTFTLEPPAGLSADAVDLRLVRHWPQRVSWRSPTYHIVPELLDAPGPVDLPAFGLKQAWLTAHIPANAPAGRHNGAVVIEGRGRPPLRVPFSVEVLPFKLAEPPDIHWGLYIDSARYPNYSDAKIDAELRDIVAHGLDTAMLYPFAHSQVAVRDGHVVMDTAGFEALVDRYVAAGLRGPWVVSLQALLPLVEQAAGTNDVAAPAYRAEWQAVTRQLAGLFQRHGWGETLWHAVDEPWRPDDVTRAATLLGYFKELGLRTWTTAGPVPPELDAALDVRCYWAGYLAANADQLRAAQESARASGDEVWMYASGCYPGQDANAQANRWACGALAWLTGVRGEWSWTFLRAKQDAWNDFDYQQGREPKDAAIVYPSPGDAAPQATLQWEGLREGIDDYRYLATLKAAGKGAALAAIEAELREAWAKGRADAEQMEAWRGRVVEAMGR